jgi:hypothetical protein
VGLFSEKYTPAHYFRAVALFHQPWIGANRSVDLFHGKGLRVQAVAQPVQKFFMLLMLRIADRLQLW